jgi:hypothetical protein
MRGPSALAEHCGMTKLSTPRDAATAVVEHPILPASTDERFAGFGVPPVVRGVVSRTDGVWESAEPSRTPILVTEQEVVFSTSAAVSLPRTKTTRRLTDATRVVAATVRRMFLTSTARPRPARRHYPPRSSYLEHALMAREMHRL